MKIRVHYRRRPTDPWTSTVCRFHQIPERGEYLAPAPVDVYRVVLTLHVMFDADFDAEVFAEHVDFLAVQNETLGDIVWQHPSPSKANS